MSSKKVYNDFPTFLKSFFPYKVQKISINAGFTCPNRDGAIGRGGCTYCNNQTFSPAYCKTTKTITQQLEDGKHFFAHKYPSMKYLAYFQSYTNTYDSFDGLKAKYEEALAVKDVVGLVIGTRPDCISDELLDYLEKISKKVFVLVEFGIESTLDDTLLRVNRGHSYETVVDAVNRTSDRGILTGGHVILGLPGESLQSILDQPKVLSKLPLNTLKLHQLQIIKGTQMEEEFTNFPEDFYLTTLDDYLTLVISYLQRLRPDMVVERFISQSPKELILSPLWGVKNHEFNMMLIQRMKKENTYQGQLYTDQKTNLINI
ncbi:MAG: TIGR01212 family radical SAM protein [Bacteroides sp.]|nr:TIGR01212 family radical SAM protein [Bacteroides sp.]NLI63357.1 TIGR01212 family radical SAM protein [Bacteroidales bacterium]